VAVPGKWIELAAVLAALGAATCTYDFDNFAHGRDASMGGGGAGGSLSTEGPGTGGNIPGTGGTGSSALGTGGSSLGTGGVGGVGSGLGGAAGSGRVTTGGQAGAGVGGAQTGGAGSADAGLAGAAGNSCSGASHGGVCWYLGSAGSSCRQVCGAHGQPSTAAAAHVGSTKQGGNAAECGVLLRLVGISGTPSASSRTDGLGFGCHIFDNGTLWWLSSPDFSVTVSRAEVRLVCGCTE